MLKTKRSVLKFKKKIYKYEYKQKINKFISIFFNNNNKNTYFSKYYFTLKRNNINISKTKIKAICLLTNRTHSINKIYNISRISLREMFAFGIIPGYKKAVW
jgi:ribosomal protein S14